MCVVYEQPREHFHSIFEMNIVWFLDYFARGLRMENKCAFIYMYNSFIFYFYFFLLSYIRWIYWILNMRELTQMEQTILLVYCVYSNRNIFLSSNRNSKPILTQWEVFSSVDFLSFDIIDIFTSFHFSRMKLYFRKLNGWNGPSRLTHMTWRESNRDIEAYANGRRVATSHNIFVSGWWWWWWWQLRSHQFYCQLDRSEMFWRWLSHTDIPMWYTNSIRRFWMITDTDAY